MMRALYRGTWHGILGQAVDFAGDAAEGDRFARIGGRWLIAHRLLRLDAAYHFPLATQQGA